MFAFGCELGNIDESADCHECACGTLVVMLKEEDFPRGKAIFCVEIALGLEEQSLIDRLPNGCGTLKGNFR